MNDHMLSAIRYSGTLQSIACELQMLSHIPCAEIRRMCIFFPQYKSSRVNICANGGWCQRKERTRSCCQGNQAGYATTQSVHMYLAKWCRKRMGIGIAMHVQMHNSFHILGNLVMTHWMSIRVNFSTAEQWNWQCSVVSHVTLDQLSQHWECVIPPPPNPTIQSVCHKLSNLCWLHCNMLSSCSVHDP